MNERRWRKGSKMGRRGRIKKRMSSRGGGEGVREGPGVGSAQAAGKGFDFGIGETLVLPKWDAVFQ